jgi:hypothetical protein
MLNECRIPVRKAEVKRPLEILSYRWEDNVKIRHKKN